MIATLALVLAAATAPAESKEPLWLRCNKEHSQLNKKTGEWIGPCWIYESWMFRLTVADGEQHSLVGKDWMERWRVLRVDIDGYPICSGTAAAAADKLKRAEFLKEQEEERERRQAMELAP